MKIKDRRHDYYDIGLGLGHDPNDPVVYVREERKIERRKRGYHRTPSNFEWFYIGFCGEVYYVLQIRHWDGSTWATDFCYDMKDVDRFTEAHYSPKELLAFQGGEGDERRRRYCKRRTLALEFEHRGQNLPGRREGQGGGFWIEEEQSRFYSCAEIFAKYNTPIFRSDPVDETLVINPLLAPFHFARVYDPYTAYQKVEQYVGGVLLAPVNPIPPVPDQVMAEIKGFDKWSFRKPPQG